MKITTTGSLGNIGRPLTELLIKAGHEVTVVTSHADKAPEIKSLGATAAVGSLTDVAFLTKAFTGSDVVYAMVPQQYDSADYKKFIVSVGKNYYEAIKASGVSRVVFLSSIGAHLAAGAGPVSGVHEVEKILNTLKDVQITFLRPGFFYTNFYNNVDMIKHMGILGNNFGPDSNLVLVHPRDIAQAAFEEIVKPSAGKVIRYVASDERIAADIATVIGTSIGKPDLKWVAFTDEQSLAGMKQGRLSEDVAKNLVEMGGAVRSGAMFEDYKKNKPAFGKTKLEEFAKEFAEKFKN